MHLLMNWTGGIANPKWKDNQTMLNKETIPQWQAYVPGFCALASLPV